jgi:hypothetical protein
MESSTFDPAVALFAPCGSTTGGHSFAHAALHPVLLAFKVYTVVPAARIGPSFAFRTLEMTLAVVGRVEASALGTTATTANTATPTAAMVSSRRTCVRTMSCLPVAVESGDVRPSASNGLAWDLALRNPFEVRRRTSRQDPRRTRRLTT